MRKKAQNLNPELRDLGTHMAGAVHMHETRETQNTVIQAPAVPNPTPYDKQNENDKK